MIAALYDEQSAKAANERGAASDRLRPLYAEFFRNVRDPTRPRRLRANEAAHSAARQRRHP